MTQDRMMAQQRRGGRWWIWAIALAIVAMAWQGTGQEVAAPAEGEAAPPVEAATASPVARLYYRDIDPKQLFMILEQIFHVKFEGVDIVSGPLTVISPGEEPVDLDGMLKLLNETLDAQDKVARREGGVVRILPRQRSYDYFIPLEHVPPEQVVEVLKDLFLAVDGKPEERAKKAEYLAVHPTKQGLILRGPKEVYDAILKYIEDTQLDVPEPTATGEAPEVEEKPLLREYVRLEYMDPDEFADLLDADETIADKIRMAVARNTVIVFSRDETVFPKVEEMRKAFDVDRLEIRYLPLAHAKAADVAGLLAKIYPQKASPEELAVPEPVAAIREEGAYGEGMVAMRRALGQMGASPSRVEELLSGAISVVQVGELTIVPDAERNALLIRTYSRNIPKILELIRELDRPLQQVLIDVFITEVEVGNSLETGVDFTRLYNDDTLKQVFQGTTTRPAGFGESVGVSYELVSNNITAYIRALAQTNKLDVISRPQIVTKDNILAHIELGRDVPIVRDTKVSTEGAVTSTVAYERVSTSLDVTPQIHPDSYVTLGIVQKIDDIGAETFQISRDFNPQVIIRRNATTNVRVLDGQTICLGGFVGDSIREEQSGVPLLKDIPLLGAVFQYKQTERVKREMILFITPHILRTPEEMLRMTNEKRRFSETDTSDDRDGEALTPQRDLAPPRYQERPDVRELRRMMEEARPRGPGEPGEEGETPGEGGPGTGRGPRLRRPAEGAAEEPPAEAPAPEQPAETAPEQPAPEQPQGGAQQ